MVQFIANHRSIFLLIQIIFLNYTNAYLDEITTTIVDENGIDIKLKWVKTKQFLANENLPIWRARSSRTYLRKDDEVMKKIGHFETYHDLDKSSAVVYIEKENSLYGFIDMRYELIGLPVDKLNEKHIVGQSRWVIHVKEEDKSESTLDGTNTLSNNDNLPSTSPTHSSSSSLSSSSSCRKRPHDYINNVEPTYIDDNSLLLLEKYQRTDHESSAIFDLNANFNQMSIKKPLGPFYPEILLLVSHNIVINDRYKLSRYDYPAKHVLYYLIYMNAVAMLFAKLAPHVEIHINIAGIIFEELKEGFPFSISLYLDNALICTNRDLVTHSVTKYINHLKSNDEEILFPEDSFDFFIYSTNIIARTDEEKKMLRGVSVDWFNIFEWRAFLKDSKLDKKFLGSIIDNTGNFQTYVDTVRELAHLMKIDDDGWDSHSIMRKNRMHHSLNYLKWSQNSIKNFEEYFRRNRNRCFLSNKPRSLNVYDIPRAYLSAEMQCKCYGYAPKSQQQSGTINCDKRLQCQRIQRDCLEPNNRDLVIISRKKVNRMPYPLDGTPCNDDMVCWRQQCVPGIVETNDDNSIMDFDYINEAEVVSTRPSIRI
ncbi:hypothetical protein PV327_009009 [Microctonus hyperodae]|uniref:Uncharacterized protein n=1 Tax=Microctonus hyperodae TaxID=165561 RepID=A0AA39FSW5_MICHY|nr:hypothetical protein PV327_009009 [Microctonus hyperodae]